MTKVSFDIKTYLYKRATYSIPYFEDIHTYLIQKYNDEAPFMFLAYYQKDVAYVNFKAKELVERGRYPILGTLVVLTMIVNDENGEAFKEYLCRGLSFMSAEESVIDLKRGEKQARGRAIRKMINLINRLQKRTDGYLVLMEHGLIKFPKSQGKTFEEYVENIEKLREVRKELKKCKEKEWTIEKFVFDVDWSKMDIETLDKFIVKVGGLHAKIVEERHAKSTI